MRVALVLGLLVAAGLVAYQMLDVDALGRWAVEQQRGFQNQMAGAVRALRTGEPGALAALFAAAGAYGFFHAVGPGHGKALIGGVGLGSSVSVARLLSLSIASSLAQALWAIILVYGGFFLLEVSAQRMTGLAEDYLAPASYLAIAAIGGLLVWRGLRRLKSVVNTGGDPDQHHGHHHDHHHLHHGDHHGHDASHCSTCGHAHGPSPEQVENLTSVRDAAALIASIAIRPCTGAIFLLVIAWQMGLIGAGAAAVVVMGLGTATFTSLVAVSSVAARTVTFASADRLGAVSQILPGLQILAGAVVIWISLTLLGNAL